MPRVGLNLRLRLGPQQQLVPVLPPAHLFGANLVGEVVPHVDHVEADDQGVISEVQNLGSLGGVGTIPPGTNAPEFVPSSKAFSGWPTIKFAEGDALAFDQLAAGMSSETLSVSIAARFLEDPTADDDFLWSFGRKDATTDFLGLRWNQGAAGMDLLYQDSLGEQDGTLFSSARPVTAVVWGVTWDGSTGRLYRNGVEVGSGVMSGAGFAPDQFTLGALRRDTVILRAPMELSHLAVVDRAATPAEMANLARFQQARM